MIFLQAPIQSPPPQTPPQTTPPAETPPPKKPLLNIVFGPSFGTYFPTSGLTRDIFGSAISSLSLSIDRPMRNLSKPKGQFQVGFEDLILSTSNGKLFAASPTVGYRYEVPVKNVLFSGVLYAGPTYLDYSVTTPNGDHIATKRLAGLSGLDLKARWGQLTLYANYKLFTKEDGLDFSGFTLGASWTVFRY